MTLPGKRLIGLDAVYTYAPTYAELLKEYRRSGHLPTFMVEANYEFEHGYYSTDLETLRRQEYWTMLSGASGQLYGNKYTWQFLQGLARPPGYPGLETDDVHGPVVRQATLVPPGSGPGPHGRYERVRHVHDARGA